MPSYNRMKRLFLGGLLWLFLLPFGLMVLSLEPGQFLDFDNLPDTNFTCVGKVIGGYYADLETNCQMFHVCTIGQADEPMDIRFLCLNGTVFDQETRVCERIDEVDCSKSEQFYSLNLELYGNSGPILEETPEVPQETESPSITINPTTPSTTTTTTKRPTSKQTNSPYFTTIRPSSTTTTSNSHQNVAGHHFRVNNPDIRFNPEEINISLNPGAPPDIRTKHLDPHHIYSDSSKVLVSHNGDNAEEQSVRVQKPERVGGSASTSPKSIIYTVDVSDSDKLPQHSDNDDFRFSDHHQQFLIETNSFRHSQSFPSNVDRNSNNQYHHPQFHSTTVKHQQPGHTTARALYLHSLKPHHPRTEKTPQRVQIPIPLLPTLPPLTFSTPAPFTLQRHIENKRYTKEHQTPPRIIISASASVSDASGRRLNYSLGTIGAAQILDTPPSSYDEYKDSDVGLDPFYHDVPKVKQAKRRRRSADTGKLNPFEIIKNEKEAVEVLKFLFTWYQSHQATATVPPSTSPASPDLIREINDQLAPASEKSASSHGDSELFKKSSRFSIVGGYRNDSDKTRRKNKDRASRRSNVVDSNSALGGVHYVNNSGGPLENASAAVAESVAKAKKHSLNPDDYVDDNYEGVVYKEDGANVTTLDGSEEDNKNYTNAGFVDPHAVAELYKYFNVLTTSVPTTLVVAADRRTMQLPEAEIDDVAKHTQKINILSEINERPNEPEGTSTTSTTPLPRHSRRRGRGRQRMVDSYQEASFRSSISKEHESKNYISPGNGPSRRGKGRNRSRFVSTTTEASSDKLETVTTIEAEGFSKVSAAADNVHFTTTEASTSKVSAAEAELETVTTVGAEAFSKVGDAAKPSGTVLKLDKTYTSTEMPLVTLVARTKDGGDFNLDYSPVFDATTESFSAINSYVRGEAYGLNELQNTVTNSSTDFDIENSGFHPTDADFVHNNNLKEFGNENADLVRNEREKETKSEVTTTEAAEENTEYLETTTSDYSRTTENTDFSIITKTDTITVESTTEPLIPTDNPSYLIKLLRYYAESAIMTSTGEPEAPYEALTERVVTPAATTEYHRNNHHRNLEGRRHSLPTLRDIYENTKPFGGDHNTSLSENTKENGGNAKTKVYLLEKLSLIEQNLTPNSTAQPETTSVISDTTVTTPLISFEDPESFATTFSATTEAKESGETSTSPPSPGVTLQHEDAHRNNYYNSFYDDSFEVPELTEKSANTDKSDVFDPTQVPASSPRAEAENVTNPMEDIHQATTRPPDVEIQKSISIPISVLETNFDVPNDFGHAQDINGLVSSERGDDDDDNNNGKGSTIPSFIDYYETTSIPSTAGETSTSTSTINYIEETKVPVVQENATEIILLNEKFPNMDMPSNINNSSHLLQVSIETTSEPIPTSTTTPSPPKIYTRKTRPTRRRPYKGQRNQFGRHRFSTELFTKKPPASEQPHSKNVTDAPLHRTLPGPTRSDLKKVSLHTTPLSSKHRYRAPTKVGKHYVFNCFGKETNRFYADPRDCRLFHYCTQGYSKNQLLDLKYVCDQKTFFDEDKLICTKVKPSRCL